MKLFASAKFYISEIKMSSIKCKALARLNAMSEITEVRVYRIENNGDLKAFASVTFNNAFVVHGIKILQGRDGLFIRMPSTKNKKTGEFKDVFHPINQPARENLTNAVLSKYSEGGSENISPRENPADENLTG